LPTRNALGSVRLTYAQTAPTGPFHVTLQVWSHSFDHPDPLRRSAVIKGVYLTQLPGAPGTNYQVSNIRITDRYGIDETGMWTRAGGFKEVGFDGYTWGDTAAVAKCVPVLDEMWNAYTGIYDERCLADPACDAMRLQTYPSQTVALPVPKLTAFNYLQGPVTFSFDIVLSAPPTAVKLKMGLVGGNGGNPLQRTATLPDEEFVIQVP
jgi:hypothetical protein